MKQENDNAQYRKIRTMSLMSIPYGIFTLVCCYLIWDMYYLPPVNATIPPLILYSLATLFEIACQPLYILSMVELAFGVRVSIEAAALFVKIFSSFVIVNFCDSENIISYFGYSQICYSITLLLGYIFYQYKRTKVKGYTSTGFKFLWDMELFDLVNSFWKQSLIKYILTEGEKHILIMFQSQYNQGVYDVVFNLGSLAARLLFQYVEETSFSIWSKMNTIINNVDEKAPSGECKEAIDISSKVLVLFLKASIILGCIFACFGPAYSHTLIYLLYENEWANKTETPKILAIYCFYIMFMAVNGITEAFIHALSDANQIRKLNYIMIGFSVTYMTVCVTCLWIFNLGTISMIISNCFNMLMRISYSLFFILQFYNKFGKHVNLDGKKVLLRALPSKQVAFALILCLVITKYTEIYFNIQATGRLSVMRLGHVAVGTVCLGFFSSMLYRYEKDFIQQFQAFRRGQLTSSQ